MSSFVLMLTRDDVTVPDAHAILELALAAGVEHIGFKDIGLPHDEMASLVHTIHGAGRQAHLAVVSLTEEDERASLRLGRELGFDNVLGGSRWQLGTELLVGTGIRYFPYVGTVMGHPGTLDGTAEQLLAEVHELREVVSGVNLLAYRHISVDGDSAGAGGLTRVPSSSSWPVEGHCRMAALAGSTAVEPSGAMSYRREECRRDDPPYVLRQGNAHHVAPSTASADTALT